MSELETRKHIRRVSQLLTQAAIELLKRANSHDDSKLEEPEKTAFEKMTPVLKGLTYGSPEYKEALVELGDPLKHHYEHNSHHPEHYPAGISDMDLFDVIEMFLDWKAAGERHADGNIFDSIRKNKERFKMSAQLTLIFLNTADRLFPEEPDLTINRNT